MSDIFENVALKYKNSPSALVLFVAAFFMLAIGLSHFAEDTYSSYIGIKSIETHFGMNVQIFDWTYWTMSIAPQISGVVFFYIYLANTNKGWALWVSLGSQAVDFLADLWYRSNGSAFTDWNVTAVSALLTFAYFTVGSEMFVTFGSGLFLKLAAPALHSWRYYKSQVEKVKESFQRGSISGIYEDSGKPRESVSKKHSFSPKFGDRLQKGSLHGVKSSRNGKELSNDDTNPSIRY